MDTTLLQRHRATIAACTTIAAAASVWYLVNSTGHDSSHGEGGSGLHRSGAVRRRPQERAPRADVNHDGQTLQELVGNTEELLHDTGHVVAAAEATLDGVATANPFAPLSPTARGDDEETEHDAGGSSQHEPSPEQQRLQKLAYQIAKHNHDRQGLVHHGVTCDECNEFPIKGPRYHCNNCPDFDLCENCEAKDNHLRTHTFTKVKIPAPWGGKEPQPVWYPGRPHKMPPTLDTPDHRQWRASLSEKYSTLLHEVDGLYAQFTCMANTPLPEDTVGWAIDHTAFNHSFDHQIMSDRISSPSLIRERLFALYDDNGDGLISFEEFLSATSMIHTKDAIKRLKRVFKGLDIDDDGRISRKDCQQVFRSYYELNREVLHGYLEVDRSAENAILVQAGHDPRDHIAGGRSLANYFNGGFPMSGPNPDYAPILPERKTMSSNGDLVPIANEITTVRTDADTIDYMSLKEVEDGKHLHVDEVLDDEIARLSADPPRPGRCLTREHVRGFKDLVELDRRMALKFKWHRGQLWVADTVAAPIHRRSSYLRVEAEDLKHFPTLRDEDYESHTMMIAVGATVRDRLKGLLKSALQLVGRTKTDTRNSREGVGLETEQSDRPNKQGEGGELGSISYVGGTGAAHTIYLTLHDAMNELLDPVFSNVEALAVEVQKTADERKKHLHLIQQRFEKLIAERWTPYQEVRPASTETHDSWKRARMRAVGKYYQKQRLRRGAGTGASMVDAFHKFRDVLPEGEIRILNQDNSEIGHACVYWGLQLEAEIALEASSATKSREVGGASESTVHACWESNADHDPTMPQFKPERLRHAHEGASGTEPASLSTGDSESPSPERLHYLAIFEAVARYADRKPGTLDLADFEELVTHSDERSPPLLEWVSGWLDLVNF